MFIFLPKPFEKQTKKARFQMLGTLNCKNIQNLDYFVQFFHDFEFHHSDRAFDYQTIQKPELKTSGN
jgi:hypothetical protein